MTLDIFKGIRLTPGQEVRAQDIKDLQNYLLSRVCDGIFEKLVPGPEIHDYEAGTRLLFPGAHGANVPSNIFAYALTSGGAYPRKGTGTTKIQIAPGTLFQKVAAATGDEPTFLPYTFAGTEEVTIANGDAANPRIDLVQMKLELVDDDSQARVTATAGVKASRDLNPLTANCETLIRARAAGFGGNAISIQFVADGTGVGSLTQSGYALTFHYENGVTTVANFETAVAASTLIEVASTDGVGTLASPGDTFGPVFLTGGTDQVLSSSNLLMKRRVQLTLSVKAGTPAASPTYPTADAGYVVIAGIFVPANWVGAGDPVTYDQNNVANLVIHDQRMPMGTPRTYRVKGVDMTYDTGVWTVSGVRAFIQGTSGDGPAYAYLPSGSGGGAGGVSGGSGRGRLIGVEVSMNPGAATPYLVRLINNAGSFTEDVLALIQATGLANLVTERISGSFGFEQAMANAPIINASAVMGPPIWGNGRRALHVPDGTEDQFKTEDLIVKFAVTGNVNIYSCAFIMAEGL